MRMFQMLAIIIASLMISGSASAQGMADAAQKADTLFSSGQYSEAYEELNAAVDAFWTKSPMFIRKAAFVSEVRGYGIYKEREAKFKDGEPLVVYVEPIAFAYGTDGKGTNSAAWSLDFTLVGPSGAVLLDEADFLELTLPLEPKTREVNLQLTINVSGLKPGTYTSRYKLKDKNSDKSASFDLPFEIVE